MKREFRSALIVFALLTGSQAIAQSTIEISPAQRTKIKEYVISQKVNPVSLKEKLVVGAVVPASVPLIPAPASWGPSFLRYQYLYSDNHIVLVQPNTRKVMQVIE